MRPAHLPMLTLVAACAACHGDPPATPDAAPAPTVPRFDGARALAHARQLCAFGPRGNGLPGHQRARAWLVERLTAAGGAVSEQPFTHTRRGARGESRFTNILARFTPALPAPAESARVFLGGHYDTRLWADADPDPAFHGDPIDGANDGASGPAVLLALVEQFAAYPPPVGVDLVLFDGEDFGRRDGDDWDRDYFLGAKHFAAQVPAGWAAPRWGAVLDLVGHRGLRLPQEAKSARQAPRAVATIWAAAAAETLPAFPAETGGAITDDHVALIDVLGWDVALLCQAPFPFTWHTHHDTMEWLDAESLRQVGQALTRALYAPPGTGGQ